MSKAIINSFPWLEALRLKVGPTGLLNRWTLLRCAGKVYQGPFVGMIYRTDRAVGSAYFPKTLGTYEKEIQPLIESIKKFSWSRIINIGAGEGYYAVGLARACPQAEVFAFEANSEAHKLIQKLASANHASISVFGACDVATLASLPVKSGQQLVVCDVEGFEKEMIDPVRVPFLVESHLLVEVHEDRAPGVEELLHRRLRPSHKIEIIRQENRVRADFPLRGLIPRLLPDGHILSIMNEMRRPNTNWLWAVPKSSVAER